MVSNIVIKSKNTELTIDEKLFKSFIGENFSCIKDICYKVNNEVHKKYVEYCEDNRINSIYTDSACCDCWIKFLTEDLIKIKIEKIHGSSKIGALNNYDNHGNLKI